MNEIITFTADEIAPDRSRVLAAQGVRAERPAPRQVREICDEALGLLLSLAEPRGLFAPISIDEFANVFVGQGHNEPDAPVDNIYEKAQRLALYAATLGNAVCDQIEARFKADDYATAVLLDTAASLMADSLSTRLSSMFLDEVSTDSELRVLPYSPGYCGWHVSGQRRLFENLKPERIGVSINESCLMQPIKSVSGVLIVGPVAIHTFKPGFSFCEACRNRACHTRMLAVSLES